MNCHFQPDGEGRCRCEHCGLVLRAEDCNRCYARCRDRSSESPGLGDYTERVLRGMGVTKERYREVKEKFGLAPTCNCEERKRWLNMVGRYLGIGADAADQAE